MKIGIITPAPPGSRYGNRVTALRWSRILKRLGHTVFVEQLYQGRALDILIALHARRSYDSIVRFHRDRPANPIIVALTGTDLYRDLARSRAAQRSLEIATRIVVLQPKALEELSGRLREKARVIYQSVAPSKARRASASRTFDVAVIGHLRAVKDPFRAALASRRLPSSSRIRILQAGGAMTEAMARRARAEMCKNPRYVWLGEQPSARARRTLAQSRVCVISSRMEGGANVLSEAIAYGVPVLASRIEGNQGVLGEDYPGYFEVGDTRGLAQQLLRAETDPDFLEELRRRCERLAPLFDLAREESEWRGLIDSLSIDALAPLPAGRR
ncbi:MAG TPA: selenoneine biosynthesis selenosugar synthase SenB [Blastocatellia bacterium]|nr:selenoneine biosynthesis selenosugar synthase SenB [Blastocatellia bacterium]